MKRLAVALGVSVLAFGGAEAYLRWFRPVTYMMPQQWSTDRVWRDLLHRKSAVPGLAYELTPNAHKVDKGVEISTNSYGMRDAEPRDLEPSTSSRIVVLGDSFTFGFGVKDREIWPRRLEFLLDKVTSKGGRPVDVLNFGVGGYGTRDEALVLEYKGLAWEPDLVIVGYVFNDPEDEPIQPLHAYFAEPEWWQYSHLLRLVRESLRRREVERLGGGDSRLYLHAEPDKWEGVERAFADMRRLTADAGCELMLVIFPIPPANGWARYRYRDLHRQVAEAGERAGMHVLDLLPSFEAYPPMTLREGYRDAHPTAQAHAIAAQAIKAYLKEHPALLVREGERAAAAIAPSQESTRDPGQLPGGPPRKSAQ